MKYLIGVVLAVAVRAFAMVSGFDRERVFYPTMVVVGHYTFRLRSWEVPRRCSCWNLWQQQRFWHWR